MATAGHITSEPNAEGKHNLKCPQCKTSFSAHITKDDKSGAIHDVVCEACHHSGAPLNFVYEANKEASNKMVADYAIDELRNGLKKSFRGSKHIKFK